MPVEDEFNIWTPKNSDFGILRDTQKAPNLRSFFDANLIDLEDDWDEPCTNINGLFPQ